MAKHSFNWQLATKNVAWKPVGFSVLLHVGLVGAMVLSMEFTPAPKDSPQLSSPSVADFDDAPQPEIVRAVAVEQAAVEAQIQRIRDQEEAARRAEQQRVAEIERRAREAEQRRQREEQRAREAVAERERAAEQARREQQEAEQRRQREEQRAREAAAERERVEAERQRAEAERQRLEAERAEQERAARERAERERQLQERLAQEQEQRSRARQQRVLTEVERYQALIRAAIQRNWIVDSSMRGQSCVLTISMARDGFVTNVQVGDGDRAVCESARAAVLRAGNLPIADDPDVYEQLRSFRLRVEPQFN